MRKKNPLIPQGRGEGGLQGENDMPIRNPSSDAREKLISPQGRGEGEGDSIVVSRRDFLSRAGCGIGMLALADLLSCDRSSADASEPDRTAQPYAVRSVHQTARAKRVIFLYMPGGPLNVDLFDPKPRLIRGNVKPLPFEKPKLERTKTGNLLASPWTCSRHGQSGTEVSELLPSVASCIDEFGWHSVRDKVHVHDLHATILHLMGFDHEKLTYRYGGRDYRLTDVHGQVVQQILA